MSSFLKDGKDSPFSGGLTSRRQGPNLQLKPYKVLLADDDPEMHNLTRLVLNGYDFEGRGLQFLCAYSGKETIALLQEHPDTALILLDVVMESDNAGLDVARQIREKLGNKMVRIVLRTGQPGQAPERDVIVNYDINDYKEKTELTAQKLFTTVTSALRAFRDLNTIEQHRRGLQTVIDATASLFTPKSLYSFAEGVLRQIAALLRFDEANASYLQVSSFAAIQSRDSEFRVLTATGQYEGFLGEVVADVLPPALYGRIEDAVQAKQGTVGENYFVGYFETRTGSRHVAYVESPLPIRDAERILLMLYANNVALAFDNIYLNQEVLDTQKNMIYMLGEAVETRSKETGTHVRRMTQLSVMLGLAYGLTPEQMHLLELATPMHDLGKIGIPDRILEKPGPLDVGEMMVMRTHTTIGHNILRTIESPIMDAAALIALQHHERWDGSGYPVGLRGEQIDITGRITALADVVDALGNKRSYKEAWPEERILELVREQRGKHFDPALVDLFLANLDQYRAIEEIYSGS